MAESCEDRFVRCCVHLYENTELLVRQLERGQKKLREAMMVAPVGRGSYAGLGLEAQEPYLRFRPNEEPWEWRFEDLLQLASRQSALLSLHVDQATRVLERARELAPMTPGRFRRANRRRGGRARGHRCQLSDGKWVGLGDFVEFWQTNLTDGGIGRVTKITPGSMLVIQRVGENLRVTDQVKEREVRRSTQTCSRVEVGVRG